MFDRFDRRWLLIGDSALRPAVLLVAGPAGAHLYAVSAVYGLVKMTSLAGFPAMIPDLVPSERPFLINCCSESPVDD
ncbi:hypothetical protein Areg01_39310 [Actinoplanes regularis]|nr:hypothetical protein Areg01_39310 [Actinoplanes regularis]